MNNNCEKIFVDMHTHTEEDSDASDNVAASSTISENQIIILANHNVASRREGIGPSGMEVNCIDEDSRLVHLLYYAKEYNDDLLGEVEKMRNQFYQKCEKICENISKNSNFSISLDISEVVSKANQEITNINCMHIVATVLAKYKDSLSSTIGEENTNINGVFKRIIYPNSQGIQKIGISLKLLVEFANKQDGIISLAHPQITFKDKKSEWFRENGLAYCLKYGIHALEIPSPESANPERIEAIQYVASELEKKLKGEGGYVTFGSDYHGKTRIDKNHADLGTMNQHIELEWAIGRLMKYHEQIGLILPKQVSHEKYT